jgi:hypothetical protein
LRNQAALVKVTGRFSASLGQMATRTVDIGSEMRVDGIG